jgi:hypothetical protein
MQRYIIAAAMLGLGGCALGGGYGYTSAELVYAQPVEYEYDVPVDRVVVVTRDVLVSDGYTVFRVERSGPDRIIWARRGDNELVRVLADARGGHVAVRGLREERAAPARGRHEHASRGREDQWVTRGPARDVLDHVNQRLRHR